MSARVIDALADSDFAQEFGVITALGSDSIAASGPRARIGEFCTLHGGQGGSAVGEVVAAGQAGLRLTPLTPIDGLAVGARVTRTDQVDAVHAGDHFAGRAVDGLGQPIDAGPALRRRRMPLQKPTRSNPLDRVAPIERMLTGIRAIDGLMPLGKGQRVGIFAASGVGKTSLLEQLMWQADCDRVVLCLVGERGREVEKMWSTISARAEADKFTLVAATSDESPSMRVRAIEQALMLAEHWRGCGEHCLLLVDSITRVAFALREMGLAAGEPPSSRGYTPNVFSALPGMVERCGAMRGSGAITAIMTVLSETDDVDDPIVELMKSVLDGHIVLSRAHAERRHFPAIDIARSVSRLSEDLLSADQADQAAAAHRLHTIYEDARSMIESGLYTAGSNAEIDAAIAVKPRLAAFLQQAKSEHSSGPETGAMLAKIIDRGAHA